MDMRKLARKAARPFRQLAEIVMPLHLVCKRRRVRRLSVGLE